MVKVLITDDSQLIRAILKNYMIKEGYEVIEAKDGNESINKFKEFNPDIVFMDIMMPNGLDGFSAVKEIRKINPKVKIIMVTSVKEQKEMDEAKKLDINGYITKPFSKEDILNAIKTNLILSSKKD